MAMKEPPHPGLSIRYDCLEPLELSVTEAAKVLEVTRQALNNVVNGKAGISSDMAFGGSAEAWLALQTAYDLAQARKRARGLSIKRYSAARGSGRSAVR